MPRTNPSDKTMNPDGLIFAALKAVSLGYKSSAEVAHSAGIGVKQAYSLLAVNHGRGNLTKHAGSYGLATRIKWSMTPRGRRKLKQLDK